MDELRKLIDTLSYKGISVSDDITVDCGFDYVVKEFYVYGCGKAGHKRFGAIQDKPGSDQWRVHGLTQTFTRQGIVAFLAKCINDGMNP